MKKKLPELVKPAPDNINTFGKESNFNKNDDLGPWETKCKFNRYFHPPNHSRNYDILKSVFLSVYKIRRNNERVAANSSNKSKVFIW